MDFKAGLFLQSTAALDNTIFENALIYLAECNTKGALGFIINRSFGRALNELEEFSHSLPFPLSDGGPVDREHLFFLHNQPQLISDGIHVDAGIHYGGTFREAVAGINSGTLTAEHLKIFVGYCGWDAGDLENEIAEGSWSLIKTSRESVFLPASIKK
jgi:putative transcriptional regulator